MQLRKVFGGISPWLMHEYMRMMQGIPLGKDSYLIDGAKVSFGYTEPHRIASVVTQQLEIIIEAEDEGLVERLMKVIELKAMRAGG
ncbi:MAG: DUF1952 domain-containing protein [Deinococcales bacterium]